MLRIDQFAHTNRLRSTHPAEKFVFAVLTLAVCLAVSRPLVSLAVILFMGGCIVLRAGIPVKFYIVLMLIPMAFLLTGVLTVAVSVSRSPLPLLWGVAAWDFNLGVTAAGLKLAVNLFLKSLGAVSCLYFLSLTTPVAEIMWVLKKLKVPGLFLELMLLVYHFVFILMDTAYKISVSQASRWGYSSLKTSYLSLGSLAANLFVKSYHHSRQLFAALLARCYQEELNVLEMNYSLSVKNISLIAAFELALLFIISRTGVGISV